jgi:hypothetical protein
VKTINNETKKVFPTGKDSLADVRALWKRYKAKSMAFGRAKLELGKRLSELQKEKAHPGNGNFVEYVREQVGIPTSTTYRLLDHFKRISGIVGNTEALQQAASECDIDLTEKKWEPALKNFASAIKKAEGMPACREIMNKIEKFKPPVVTANRVAKNEADFAKDRAVVVATGYLGRFEDKEFVAKWHEFCREVLDELPEQAKQLDAAKKPSAAVNKAPSKEVA